MGVCGYALCLVLCMLLHTLHLIPLIPPSPFLSDAHCSAVHYMISVPCLFFLGVPAKKAAV